MVAKVSSSIGVDKPVSSHGSVLVGVRTNNPEIVGENQNSEIISFTCECHFVSHMIRLAVFNKSSDGDIKGEIEDIGCRGVPLYESLRLIDGISICRTEFQFEISLTSPFSGKCGSKILGQLCCKSPSRAKLYCVLS